MSSLYTDKILSHAKNPHNFGKLDEADLSYEDSNPTCGDNQSWSVKTQKQKNREAFIEDVRFAGEGCAISMAAGSLLSEKIKGMSLSKVSQLSLSDMEQMIGGPIAAGRQNCLMMPLELVKKAVGNSRN